MKIRYLHISDLHLTDKEALPNSFSGCLQLFPVRCRAHGEDVFLPSPYRTDIENSMHMWLPTFRPTIIIRMFLSMWDADSHQ